jgi:hypothetical protein
MKDIKIFTRPILDLKPVTKKTTIEATTKSIAFTSRIKKTRRTTLPLSTQTSVKFSINEFNRNLEKYLDFTDPSGSYKFYFNFIIFF